MSSVHVRVDPHRVEDHRLGNLLHSIALVAGMGVFLLVLGHLVWGPGGAWWIAGLGVVLLVFTPRASPDVVLRMYRARPFQAYELPELQQIVAELAARAELPRVPRLHYVPSRMMNAFSIGDRAAPVLGLTDGLLRRLTPRELVGVLAHEVSHIRNGDLWVMSLADVISRITSSLALVGQFLVLLNLPLVLTGQAYLSWWALLLLIAGPTIIALLQLALSRTREFDADLGAVRLTGDPVGLASALQKLERHERGFFETILMPGRRNPEPSILRTHPATPERVARLLDLSRPDRPFEVPIQSFLVPPAMPVVERAPRYRVVGVWY